MKLNIVYEDNDVIIINKPPGLPVHEGIRTEKTLTDLLIKHYPPIKDVGDPLTSSGQINLRPGIVHRLDKDTSGLMVVAKNNATFYFLKKQFTDRKIDKKYIVLACGHIKNKKGVITGKIGRLKDKQIVSNSKFKIMNSGLKLKKFREAITEYRVLKYLDGYTLCEAHPKTGRMHQIRVHFKSIGHPVAGDKKYIFRKQKNTIKLPRQFLHASYLSFSLPNGKKLAFEADLPDDLGKVLSSLEK